MLAIPKYEQAICYKLNRTDENNYDIYVSYMSNRTNIISWYAYVHTNRKEM